MKKTLLFPLVILTLLVTTLLSMCSKTIPDVIEDNTVLLKKGKVVVFHGIGSGNPESYKKAQQISVDKDWKAYKELSNELLLILIKRNIDLKNENNFNSTYFYKQLGADAVGYKDKMQLAKEHVAKVYKKYFSDIEICSSCNTLTPQKKEAYAKVLDQIRESSRKKGVNGVNKTQDAPAEPGPGAPDCWNLKFFACGGICALTIEVPPAFALCMAICIVEYCEPPIA